MGDGGWSSEGKTHQKNSNEACSRHESNVGSSLLLLNVLRADFTSSGVRCLERTNGQHRQAF